MTRFCPHPSASFLVVVFTLGKKKGHEVKSGHPFAVNPNHEKKGTARVLALLGVVSKTMGAQHGYGHGRERQGGAEARKRVWPGLFLGLAIIVVLVVSGFVSIAFSPLVHDLYWPSYHPPGLSKLCSRYIPTTTHTIHHSISQSINQLSRSPVQLVPRCSLQSWIHASSHLTWYRKSGLGEIMHGLTETLLPGGPRFARDDDGIQSIAINALPLMAPREKKRR